MEQIVKDFQELLDEIRMYRQMMSIASFDANTVAPKASIAQRAKRNGFFSKKVFEMGTGERMKGLLEALAPHKDKLDDIVAAQYRLAKKSYDQNTLMPAELVKEYNELIAKGNQAWEKAREDNDFEYFAPYLEQIVAKTKEMVGHRNTENKPIYDMLLDDYEEGMTMEIYDEFFAKLRATIVPLLKQIVDSGKQFDNSFMHSHVPTEIQKSQAEFIAKKIGYDLDRGYITHTTHPFCSGSHRTDVRITTRYDENDFASSFYSILHECGHAIYEQSMGDDIADTNLSRGVSMGIHESQSRFYENCIGRSREFWQYITEELKGYLPQDFANITPEQFYMAANVAKPSLIRVEADELTYSLHIMIRYEIERMLFNSEVEVKDLPALWNKKYEEYLGITPPTDALGVLQDIHWSWGYFGYFPTYALGSAYAAQFLAYIREEMDVDALIAKGDFAAITKWLNEKIHTHGSKFTPEQLMEKMNGEQLNADYYCDYLQNKFKSVYGLS